ncbi:MAG TPA: hypothetical protein VFO27_02920, partial [Bryobacteraceae bacterium]|nr:hypothetical protein [Bryobacteraceae bacterium]
SHALLSWFPDGKWLAVVGKTNPSEPYALFLLSIESGEKRRLTSPPQRIFGDASPAVSPDGRAVVFSRFVADNISDLFLLELSVELMPKWEPARLTFESRYSDHGAWTPDGSCHRIQFRHIPYSGPVGNSTFPARVKDNEAGTPDVRR